MPIKKTIRIGIWNVRGMSDKMGAILQETKKYYIDILLRNETKRKETQ